MKILTTLTALLMPLAAAQAEDCPGSLKEFLEARGYVEIELAENTAKQFEVHVTMNGEKLLLIVDTGASHTLFSRNRLKKMGLELEKTNVEFSGIGKKQRLYSTQIDGLEIAGTSTGPIAIFAADLSHMRQMLRGYGSRAPDGLIGADFLARYSAILEVKYSKMYLRIR
jgi:predicted aspartyl protease